MNEAIKLALRRLFCWHDWYEIDSAEYLISNNYKNYTWVTAQWKNIYFYKCQSCKKVTYSFEPKIIRINP